MAVATPAKWVGKGLTAADPRLIESVADYVALEQYPVLEGGSLGIGDRDGFYYKLTTDLDLGDTARNPLANVVANSHVAITIKLDGDGHTITNGKWWSSTVLRGGLISWLGVGGTVSNLHITSSSTYSTYSGGFVGNNKGTITACSVTSSSSSSSSPSGSGYSGGFVAGNDGTITACSVTSSSSSSPSSSGGFVGYANRGTILNSLSACTLGTGTTRKGFAAFVQGTSIFTSNYWDTTYSITPTVAETNATGVTTAQAQAGDTSPINGLSAGAGAGYWYYQADSYPQLTAPEPVPVLPQKAHHLWLCHGNARAVLRNAR